MPDRERPLAGERPPKPLTRCYDRRRQALRPPVEPGLHATIRVVDQPTWWLPTLDGHEQCIAGKLGPEMVGHAPAHDLAGGHVLDRGQVEPALAGRNVADIGQPDGIGMIGSKVPPQQVRRHRIVMPAVGCAWNTTPSLDTKPACPHQPFDPLAADLDTSGAQLGVHAWTAIGPPARGKDRPDPLAHPAVLLVVASRAAAQPGVEAAHRSTNEPA